MLYVCKVSKASKGITLHWAIPSKTHRFQTVPGLYVRYGLKETSNVNSKISVPKWRTCAKLLISSDLFRPWLVALKVRLQAKELVRVYALCNFASRGCWVLSARRCHGLGWRAAIYFCRKQRLKNRSFHWQIASIYSASRDIHVDRFLKANFPFRQPLLRMMAGQRLDTKTGFKQRNMTTIERRQVLIAFRKALVFQLFDLPIHA